jgi:hypothetical protein
MDELKAQIRLASSRAASLSREATQALRARDWQQGRALMREAVTASKICQKLIEQLHQNQGGIYPPNSELNIKAE